MDGRLYEDVNVAMSPSGTPSGNGEQVLNESNHKTSSSEQDLKAPTERQNPEKISGVNGIGPDPSVERLAHRDGDEEQIVYPSGLKLFILALALCLSIFLVALDSTIIATAVPRITDQFNSLNDVGWYGSAYLLTTSGFQLVFGKLYTFFPIKWVFLVAIAIFELGSLVCGVAPNSAALIVGRAIAGLGSAGIFSGAYLIIAMAQPLEKRPMFQGFFGAMYGVASIVGPLMGGAFTAKVTWRWCFYINLPIGGVALAVIFLFFNPVSHGGEDPTNRPLTWRQRLEQFDILGTTFFLAGVVCLLIALQWGGSTYPWSSGRVVALLVVCGVCLVVFVGIQFWRPETATIDPRMMRQRSIWAAGIFTFCMGSAFFVTVYYLPIWFQAVKDVSAYQSGIRNIPFLVAAVVGTVASGALVTQTGYYTPFMLASSALTAVGAGLLTTFDPETGHAKWIGYQVIVGLGIGLGLQQPQIVIQTVLDISEIPVATALMFFIQLFGATIFVSVGESVLTNRVINYISEHVPGVDAVQVAMAGATSFRSAVPAEYVPGIVQEYNTALTQVFEIALVLACLTTIGSLAMEWRSVKGKKIEVGA